MKGKVSRSLFISQCTLLIMAQRCVDAVTFQQESWSIWFIPFSTTLKLCHWIETGINNSWLNSLGLILVLIWWQQVQSQSWSSNLVDVESRSPIQDQVRITAEGRGTLPDNVSWHVSASENNKNMPVIIWTWELWRVLRGFSIGLCLKRSWVWKPLLV